VQEDLRNGEEIANCPSCSLRIRVIYDPDMFGNNEDDDDSEENEVS
jgi:diphthamide biosynthesis protein 3